MSQTGPETPFVVIDACSLTASVRRHLLSICASFGLFHPVVSEQIFTEARRALPKTLRHSGMSDDEKLYYAQHVITLFSEAFPDACHPASSERPIESRRPLPDPDDEHVLDLAIVSGAKRLVTENLKDFPKNSLAPFNVTALSTDHFLHDLLSQDPDIGLKVLTFLQTSLAPDAPSEAHILGVLRRVGLKQTATLLAAS